MEEKRLTPIERFLSWIKTLDKKFLTNRILYWIFKTKDKRKLWIEIFVIFDIFFAFVWIWLLDILSPIGCLTWLPISLVIICVCYRIVEIIFYQFFALLVTIEETLRSPERMLALLILNYFEIIFWFAFFYRISYDLFLIREGVNISLNSISGSLYFSVVTMTTLGYGDITPNNIIAMFLISFQTLIGLYIALLIIARFIPFLRRTQTKK